MKRLITFLALVGFSAVSLAAVVRVVRTELVPANQFDHAAFETWLAHEDVAAADPVRLRRAAQFLERDFHDDRDWRPYFAELDPAAKQRFNANIAALSLLLFEQRAERYATLPRHYRPRYLEGQLNDFSHWYLLDAKGRKVQGIELFQSSTFAATVAKLQAEPASKSHTDFLRDLQAHAMKKIVGRFVPGGREKKP